MHKLLPLLALIVTASISVGRPAVAESRFAGPLPSPLATDVADPDGAVVLVGGMGGGGTTGGMGGGAMTGGMGGGTTGGMGGGGTTGGMGGGAVTGGMGGGTTGGMGGGGATGGMGGATTGGMGGGGMTGGMGGGGMTGGGMGGTNGYSNVPSGGGDPYSRSETTGDGPQLPPYYHCITQQSQCSVSSALGALRSGASCTCLLGGKGKIK
jgi:hypothetical protein